MKTIAASLLAASVLFSSCKDQMSTNESNIGFTADVLSYTDSGVSTKSAPIGVPTSPGTTYVSQFVSAYGESGFIVNAYQELTPRLSNAKATYSEREGIWNVSQEAMWLSGETLSFYAYAPADAAVSDFNLGQSTGLTFGYEVPAQASSQPDVMVGFYSGTGTSAANGTRVAPLKFAHPLAAVQFKAGGIDGAQIKSIKITNVAPKGTCTLLLAKPAHDDDDDDVTLGFFWEIDKTAALKDYVIDFSKVSITAEQGKVIGGVNDVFMFIPQTFGADSKLVVDLSLAGEDLTLSGSLKDIAIKSGKISRIIINRNTFALEGFSELSAGSIVAWDEQSAVSAGEFELETTIGYLCSGPDFNRIMSEISAEKGPITNIVFDSVGRVDETGTHIEDTDPAKADGMPIYAAYKDGVVTITSNANKIVANQDCSGMFKDMSSLKGIEFGLNFDSTETTNTSYMFSGCSAIEKLILTDVLNTSKVTDMSYMFNDCSSATRLALGNKFITENVTNMEYMFCNCCLVPNLELGNYFNTWKVTNMDHMFYNCYSFGELELMQLFYTLNVTNMDYMFYNINVDVLHLNSHFALSNPRPSANSMMVNAINSGQTVIAPRVTWNWLKKETNTGWNRSASLIAVPLIPNPR